MTDDTMAGFRRAVLVRRVSRDKEKLWVVSQVEELRVVRTSRSYRN